MRQSSGSFVPPGNSKAAAAAGLTCTLTSLLRRRAMDSRHTGVTTFLHLALAGQRHVARRVLLRVVPLVPEPEAPHAVRAGAAPRREDGAVLVQVLAVGVVQDGRLRGAGLRLNIRSAQVRLRVHARHAATATPPRVMHSGALDGEARESRAAEP